MVKLISYEEAIKAIPNDDLNGIEDLTWTGPFPIPTVGRHIHILMNGFGEAVVTGYQSYEGERKTYLGIIVDLINPPDWFLTNNGGRNAPAAFFGSDLIDHSRKEVIDS